MLQAKNWICTEDWICQDSHFTTVHLMIDIQIHSVYLRIKAAFKYIPACFDYKLEGFQHNWKINTSS